MSATDLRRRSVEFGMPARGNDQSQWPFFTGFIKYPYNTASTAQNSLFTGPTLAQAIGPDGIELPPGGIPVDIYVPLDRDANYLLHWIRYAAWRPRLECDCEPCECPEENEAYLGAPGIGNNPFVGLTVTGALCNSNYSLRYTVSAGPTYRLSLYDASTNNLLAESVDFFAWVGPINLVGAAVSAVAELSASTPLETASTLAYVCAASGNIATVLSGSTWLEQYGFGDIFIANGACDTAYDFVMIAAPGPVVTFQLRDLSGSVVATTTAQSSDDLQAGAGVALGNATGSAPFVSAGFIYPDAFNPTVPGTYVARVVNCMANYKMGSRDFLLGEQDFLSAPGTSSPFTAQAQQLVPWNSYVEVSVWLISGGDRDYYGGQQFSPQAGGVAVLPDPVTALSGRQDGPGQLAIRALLAKNTTVRVQARNTHPTETLRLNGTLFGYKVA